MFARFEDREAFQIEILSFGIIPGLLNKQTNTLKLTKQAMKAIADKMLENVFLFYCFLKIKVNDFERLY